MQDNYSILFWAIVVSPSVFGLNIFLVQYRDLVRLKNREKYLFQSLEANERLVAAYEAARQRMIHEDTFGSTEYEGVFQQLAASDFLIMKFDAQGKLIHRNRRADEMLGFREMTEEKLSFSEICRPRTRRLIVSELRRLSRGEHSRKIPVSITNRFGEVIRLEIRLFVLHAGGEVLVLADLLHHQPGFGMLRMGPLIESMLFRSRLPVILLEKDGRFGNWRSGRISWLSASAARLIGLDVIKANGLPLEIASPALALLLTDAGQSGFSGRLWDQPLFTEDAYLLSTCIEGDYCLMFLQRVAKSEIPQDFPDIQEAGDRDFRSGAEINFEQLLQIIDGDEEFLKILIPGYLSSLRECRREFRQGVLNSSPERLKFLHHKIKATIRTFSYTGMDAIFHEAIALPTEAPGPETEKQKNELIARMNEACTKLEKAINLFGAERNLLVRQASANR